MRLVSAGEEFEEFGERAAVEDGSFVESRSTGLFEAETDGGELADAVRVGRDGDEDSGFADEAGIFSGDVETIGAGVEFEEAAVLLGMGDDALNVDLVAGALEEQASRGVAEDVEVAIVHGAENALGLLLLVHGEAGVDGADGVVEFAEDFIGVVESAVDEDVDFSGFENANAGELLVELVDGADLFFEALDGESVGDFETGRVVADADVCVSAALCGGGHLLEGVDAVAGFGVHVEVAAEVFLRDEGGDLVFAGQADFVETFAEFGRDELQVEFLVEGFFRRERCGAFEGGEAAGDTGKAGEVRLGAGVSDESESPVLL